MKKYQSHEELERSNKRKSKVIIVLSIILAILTAYIVITSYINANYIITKVPNGSYFSFSIAARD